MKSKIDEVCAKILLTLLKDKTDYAQLQRRVGAGSVATIKSHIKHLTDKGLVEVNRENRGMRFYYKISLTKKGIDVASSLKQKSN